MTANVFSDVNAPASPPTLASSSRSSLLAAFLRLHPHGSPVSPPTPSSSSSAPTPTLSPFALPHVPSFSPPHPSSPLNLPASLSLSPPTASSSSSAPSSSPPLLSTSTNPPPTSYSPSCLPTPSSVVDFAAQGQAHYDVVFFSLCPHPLGNPNLLFHIFSSPARMWQKKAVHAFSSNLHASLAIFVCSCPH